MAKLATPIAADTRFVARVGTTCLGLVLVPVTLYLWLPHGTIVAVLLIAPSVAIGRSIWSEAAWSGSWDLHSPPGISIIFSYADSFLERRGLPLSDPGAKFRTGEGTQLFNKDQILD